MLNSNKREASVGILYLIVFIIFSLIYSLGWYSSSIFETKVDLPEEYKLITKDDNLKGYFDKDSILHIEFDHDNNGIKFIWNDDEESIPVDSTPVMLQYTDENTVYLGPID